MLYWVIMIDYYVSVLYVIIIDYIVDSFKEYILNLSEAYSGVIAACGTHGKYDTAKGLLDEMRQFQVESNAVVLNAAMSAFIKCGILGDAYQIYYDMSKQQVRPDLETYNTLMQSFVQQSYWEGALHTLETIRSSTQDPDAWTWFGWFWMIDLSWFTIDLPLIYHWFTIDLPLIYLYIYPVFILYSLPRSLWFYISRIKLWDDCFSCVRGCYQLHYCYWCMSKGFLLARSHSLVLGDAPTACPAWHHHIRTGCKKDGNHPEQFVQFSF